MPRIQFYKSAKGFQYLLALAVFLHAVGNAAVLAADNSATLAVVPGQLDKTPAAQYPDLVASLIGACDGVTLLEQAEVVRIMAEHKLNLGGLAAEGVTVRLGRILPVDIFVVVDHLPTTGKETLLLTAFEARTGKRGAWLFKPDEKDWTLGRVKE